MNTISRLGKIEENFSRGPNFVWYASSFFIAFLMLAFAVIRIDFHADEAIYLAGVPFSLSNDSGVFFHVIYLALGWGTPTPVSTRWTSLILGLVLIASSTRIVYRLVPEANRWVAMLIPMLIVVSYQGVFSILRVRPEISWIAVSSVAALSLVELRFKKSLYWQVLLVVALVLLPMNHLLALLASVFFAGYIALFGRFFLGFRWSCISVAALPIGLVINRGIRSWVVTGQVELLPTIGAGLGGERGSIKDFLWNVFWNAPKFLSDTAATSSWWQVMFAQAKDGDGLHCIISNSFWGAALLAPLFFKSWEQRYVAAIPLFSLIAFYSTGYFNPTYAPLLAIFGLLTFVVIFANELCWSTKKTLAAMVIFVSLINGSSFLTTRVMNHGTATFFVTEASLRARLASFPESYSIAVAERLQSVIPKHARAKSILFKEALPSDVDIVVVDHYDFEMYRFVPDYEVRRAEVETAVSQMECSEQIVSPVYKRELLFDRVKQNQSIASEQGSWFFRNSVDYKITVLKSVHPAKIATLEISEPFRK